MPKRRLELPGVWYEVSRSRVAFSESSFSFALSAHPLALCRLCCPANGVLWDTLILMDTSYKT